LLAMRRVVLLSLFACAFALELVNYHPVLSEPRHVLRKMDKIAKCGDNCNAFLDPVTHKLLLNGTGPMYSYSWFKEDFPKWHNDSCRDFIFSIQIDEGIESIGESSFTQLTQVTEIIIPSTVTLIGDSAFLGCTGLSRLIFKGDSQLVEIQSGAFQNVGSEEITIPDRVEKLGDAVFSNCKQLYCLTIGSSQSRLKHVGEQIFRDSTELHSVIFFGNDDPKWTDANPFDRTDVKEVIVPLDDNRANPEFQKFGGVYVKRTKKSNLKCSRSWVDEMGNQAQSVKEAIEKLTPWLKWMQSISVAIAGLCAAFGGLITSVIAILSACNCCCFSCCKKSCPDCYSCCVDKCVVKKPSK